ncbi:unnamed protein product [Cunninghamella blakesleeana]
MITVIKKEKQFTIGDYVHHLIFGHYYLKYSLTIQNLRLLNQVCPNIQVFDNFFYSYYQSLENQDNYSDNDSDDDGNDLMYFSALKYWTHLTKFPFWFTYYGNYWYHRLLMQ